MTVTGRQVAVDERIQNMEANALRTSHNPPAAEVLDLCDRMGIVVWDEVFDKWDRTAGRQGGEPPLKAFSQRHIQNVVRRDRNHPCVEALDSQGTANAVADNLIEFAVTGPGEIVGVGNGNPLSVEPFQANHRSLFYGKAMLIVRSVAGQSGTVQVRATSKGLESASVSLTTR
jgi:hypothetical protein